jgi:hypothetical protein
VSDSDFVEYSTSDVAVDYGKSFVWDRVPCLPITPDQIHTNTDVVAINPCGTQMVRDFQTPFTMLGPTSQRQHPLLGNMSKTSQSEIVPAELK